MARVMSVGGIGTLMETRMGAQPEGASVNIAVALFAKLDQGVLVIDPNSYTLTVAMPLDERASAERLEETLWTMFSFGDLPPEHRQSHWQRVVDALAERGISTDPETLMSLPFELVLERAALDAMNSR
jgi:hypothetical protein